MEMELALLPEVQYPPAPDVTANTLGKRAVTMALHAEAEVEFLDSHDSDGLDAAEQLDHDRLRTNVANRHRCISSDIIQVRNRLRRLDPIHKSAFDEYCRSSTPRSLRRLKAHQAFENLWASWLAKADQETVMDFLKWHTDAHARLAKEPEVVEAIVEQKAEYKEGLVRGVDEGWLHSDALTAAEKVDRVKVYIGDIFDLLFSQRAGYHQQGSEACVIGTGLCISESGVDDVAREVRRILKHEDTHAVHPGFGYRCRNEATTEHIAHSIDHGKPDVINPDHRMNVAPPVYESERRLYAYLLEEGTIKIPARLLTRAYSQVKECTGAHTELYDAFDGAWGHLAPERRGAMVNADRYIASLEIENQRQGMGIIEAGDMAARQALVLLKEEPEIVFRGPQRQPLSFVA